MSRVKKVWRQGERPVRLYLLVSPGHSLYARFACPQCGEPREVRMSPRRVMMECSCRSPVRLILDLTLEELENEEEKGE